MRAVYCNRCRPLDSEIRALKAAIKSADGGALRNNDCPGINRNRTLNYTGRRSNNDSCSPKRCKRRDDQADLDARFRNSYPADLDVGIVGGNSCTKKVGSYHGDADCLTRIGSVLRQAVYGRRLQAVRATRNYEQIPHSVILICRALIVLIHHLYQSAKIVIKINNLWLLSVELAGAQEQRYP